MSHKKTLEKKRKAGLVRGVILRTLKKKGWLRKHKPVNERTQQDASTKKHTLRLTPEDVKIKERKVYKKKNAFCAQIHLILPEILVVLKVVLIPNSTKSTKLAKVGSHIFQKTKKKPPTRDGRGERREL